MNFNPTLGTGPNNLPPAGTSISFSPLIEILTLPLGTSLFLATSMTVTRINTIAVKKPTPNPISNISYL